MPHKWGGGGAICQQDAASFGPQDHLGGGFGALMQQ